MKTGPPAAEAVPRGQRELPAAEPGRTLRFPPQEEEEEELSQETMAAGNFVSWLPRGETV